MTFRDGFKQCLLLLFLGFLLAPHASKAQTGPQDYYMECDPDSIAYIYANWWTNDYVPCTITINGQLWPNCRVRIRGDSSRALPKKSLKIKTDGALFPNGNDVMNFNASWYDTSYMRLVMATRFFDLAGVPCYDAEHGRLHLNGGFWGLYVVVQAMDDVFLTANGLDTTANLYKAKKDGASLTIEEDIYTKWEKKTNKLEPWDDLQSLIDSLHYVPDDRFGVWAEANFDLPEIMSIMASNALLANGSTYYHNYYMYHDIHGTGKWSMFPWDVDKTFAQYGASYPYHRSSPPWMRDNPLPERVFITDSLFTLFHDRLDELVGTYFNPGFFYPIMDSLQVVLEESVANDTTDNIPDLSSWYWVINNEKTMGIEGRIVDTQAQLDQNPRSLRMDPVFYSFQDSVPLSWHPSQDPNGDPVQYVLRYSQNYSFPDESTVSISGIQDTTYTILSVPPDGNYYWRVYASDGDPAHEVMGWDSYNKFKVDQGTDLPPVISTNTTLYSSASPYFITQDLLVEPGVTLTVNPGVEIRLADSVKVTVQGVMNVMGTESNPVHFMRNLWGDRWGALCFEVGSGPSTLRYAKIEGASVGGDHLWEKSAISSYQTDLVLEHMTFEDCEQCVFVQEADLSLTDSDFLPTNLLENLNVKDGSVTIERCVFWNAGVAGDAVDFDTVNPGVIRDCEFYGLPGSDDLVDLGLASVNISLEGNYIHDAQDKGVSVGERSEATLFRNVMANCSIGVAVKDSSLCHMDRNTFYGNQTGLSVYQKIIGAGGGVVDAANCIFSQSVSDDIAIDSYSVGDVRYSISDSDSLAGSDNLVGDPMLRDPLAGDFQLGVDSPCIDAGDPSSPLDPDQTVADMGAFYFDRGPLAVVINEINYHSALDFDPKDWVELHNPLDIPVDLSGFKFKDVGHAFVIPEGTLIGAHNYLVLAENIAAFEAVFPSVPNVLGDLGFGFSGSGEMLLFTDPDDNVYDWVNYSDLPPWPVEPDGHGPTLELIDYLSDNSLPESWAASMGHGTPGGINSATDATGIGSGGAPHATSLAEAFPNPFNPRCTIRFSLAGREKVELGIYDLQGRKVADLIDGPVEAGNHERIWDGRDRRGRQLSSGIYFLRMKAGSRRISRKLVLLR